MRIDRESFIRFAVAVALACYDLPADRAMTSEEAAQLVKWVIDMALGPARLEAAQIKLAETIEQLETAKVEVQKPFTFEEELKEKSERLNALNIELNLDKKDPAVLDAEPEETEEQPERKCANRER